MTFEGNNDQGGLRISTEAAPDYGASFRKILINC